MLEHCALVLDLLNGILSLQVCDDLVIELITIILERDPLGPYVSKLGHARLIDVAITSIASCQGVT